MGGWNFAPRGFAMCNGQLMSISQNSALFSLLGTNFGGDGQQTFGLPDLRGRVPMHWGQGPGTSNYNIGQNGGTEKPLHCSIPKCRRITTLLMQIIVCPIPEILLAVILQEAR